MHLGYEYQHAVASKSQASKNGKRLRSYASDSSKTGLGITETRGSTSCLVDELGDPTTQASYRGEKGILRNLPAHVCASPRLQEDPGSATAQTEYIRSVPQESIACACLCTHSHAQLGLCSNNWSGAPHPGSSHTQQPAAGKIMDQGPAARQE